MLPDKQPKSSEEFFYLDDNGIKQDAELHGAIINPVDHPVDEKIMAPIRNKHRDKWLAEQAKNKSKSKP